MRRATEIYSRGFDLILRQVTPEVRAQIQAKIAELGMRLEAFPHHRLQGRPEFRLRAGDYRVVDRFDLERNDLYHITLGHRREIYRR